MNHLGKTLEGGSSMINAASARKPVDVHELARMFQGEMRGQVKDQQIVGTPQQERRTHGSGGARGTVGGGSQIEDVNTPHDDVVIRR